MARIAGIDLPKNKRGVIGLTYIYGIGRSTAAAILDASGIDQSKKVNDWDDDDLSKIRGFITDNLKTEGELQKRFAGTRTAH
jgi:small subunit ribosomal protein S13